MTIEIHAEHVLVSLSSVESIDILQDGPGLHRLHSSEDGASLMRDRERMDRWMSGLSHRFLVVGQCPGGDGDTVKA